MSFVWKIIRIMGLYVGSFFVCVIIAAIALDSLPDALEALFVLLTPITFVWWYERRRNAQMVEKIPPKEGPSLPLSRKIERATNSRLDQSGQFDPDLGKVAQIARPERGAIASSRNAAPKFIGKIARPSTRLGFEGRTCHHRRSHNRWYGLRRHPATD